MVHSIAKSSWSSNRDELVHKAWSFFGHCLDFCLGSFELYGMVANILTVHFLEGLEVVVRVGEGHKAVARALFRNLILDHLGLRQRLVLLKCAVHVFGRHFA